jgi:uncharacterized repeat protein (TIGR04076 family)
MYEVTVTVGKVLGTCTAAPPMKRGDHFIVRDGDITIPEGGYICLWAFQSVLPLITPKERAICEHKDEDWMWRVQHVQCPDPKGRVVFKVEQTAVLSRRELEAKRDARSAGQGIESSSWDPPSGGPSDADPSARTGNGHVRDLRVVVEQVKGKCTSRMKPGDAFLLQEGRLHIPPGRHFCLYALHAALPLLPAKQRSTRPGDWLAEDHHVICPDPAGNVILRIEPA